VSPLVAAATAIRGTLSSPSDVVSTSSTTASSTTEGVTA